MTALTRLLTDKHALGHGRIDVREADLAPGEGEAVLRISRLALTTNNITYAAFGDFMQYWSFFPTGVEGWGQVPAWGFADVAASRVPGVEAGERFYGYFPIASHLRVVPVRVSERGFYDGAPHRRELVSAYNHYSRVTNDAAYRAADENAQALLRPLFITSLMLADFLQDNSFFGAARLVVSSASSKTAYGTAFCLAQQHGVELVALSSARNLAFVAELACYRRAIGYDALESLPADVPTLYVDFSGDEALRARVHRHFGASLLYDCFVGSAQNTSPMRPSSLPGPAPKFFFAPEQIQKRNADWGHAEMNRRFNAAQLAFIRRVADAHWMDVVEHRGFEAARQLIAELHDGRVDPRAGHVVVLD